MQLLELAKGLESSGAMFLWVVNPGEMKKIDLGRGFCRQGQGRGLVVSDWVNQREILHHKAVKVGFLSHCGWSSVTESMIAGVPILAWPMMADQHLNARMVVDMLEIGVRVETCDGSVRGSVKAEGVERSVKRLLGSVEAVKKGGSSWTALTELIDEVCRK